MPDKVRKFIYEMQYNFVILHHHQSNGFMENISPSSINSLMNLIEGASRPVIVTHMKPDGDAIGSSLAMYHFLRMSGKNDSCIVLNDRYPRYLEFLIDEGARKAIRIHSENADEAIEAIRLSDLIICLDFNAFHRTENLCQALAGSTAPKILIDHHLNPDAECFTLCFSVTEVSSASELLYHILMAVPKIKGNASDLPSEAADALMTGMTTDTNNFGNSVFPSTLKMASELLDAGIDRYRILDYLYNHHSENRLRLMGHMMKDLLTITDDGVAYIVLDRNTQDAYEIEDGDTEGFVNMPLSIEDVRMSILIKEDSDRLRVSVRSKRGTSANRCARMYFNGGGHENAAGGRLRIPEDIASVKEAGKYIETHTHRYFNQDNPDNEE